MKKKLFLMSLLLAGVVNLKAGNGLSLGSTTFPQGGTTNIEIILDNDDYSFTGFFFELTLPEGIDFVFDENDPPRPTFEKSSRFSDHSVSSSYIESTRSGRFACLSLSSTEITGKSGTLLNIPVTVQSDLSPGTELDALIAQIEFTTLDGDRVNFDDVPFKIVIDEPDDGRIKFNETSDRLPNYNAGEKGDVRMKRTVKTGVWNTIVLPFTLTKAKAEAIFGSDMELATFSGFATEYTDDDDVTPDAIVINFADYKMTARKGMTGGTPYLLRVHKNEDIEIFEADDVTLTKTVTPAEGSDEWDTQGKFTGSLVKSVVPPDGLFISNDEFWYSTGKTNIKAFRGWFELGAVLGKDTDFGAKVRININGEPTYIEDIQTDQVVDGVYNIQGMLIGDNVDLNRLPKGIYIVNGKKVMVK